MKIRNIIKKATKSGKKSTHPDGPVLVAIGRNWTSVKIRPTAHRIGADGRIRPCLTAADIKAALDTHAQIQEPHRRIREDEARFRGIVQIRDEWFERRTANQLASPAEAQSSAKAKPKKAKGDDRQQFETVEEFLNSIDPSYRGQVREYLDTHQGLAEAALAGEIDLKIRVVNGACYVNWRTHRPSKKLKK